MNYTSAQSTQNARVRGPSGSHFVLGPRRKSKSLARSPPGTQLCMYVLASLAAPAGYDSYCSSARACHPAAVFAARHLSARNNESIQTRSPFLVHLRARITCVQDSFSCKRFLLEIFDFDGVDFHLQGQVGHACRILLNLRCILSDAHLQGPSSPFLPWALPLAFFILSFFPACFCFALFLGLPSGALSRCPGSCWSSGALRLRALLFCPGSCSCFCPPAPASADALPLDLFSSFSSCPPATGQTYML